MRTIPMLLKAVAVAAALHASQASAFFYLDDTTGSPTYNRPLEDFSDLSAIGTDVAYDTFSFSVTVSGTYTFRSLARPVLEPAWDNFLFLYEASFDPNAPLVNGIVGDDDFNGNVGRSGFDVALSTGVAYTLVTTGYESPDVGAYINIIRGPGEITSPVPEPETYALLLAGLGMVMFIAGRRRTP